MTQRRGDDLASVEDIELERPMDSAGTATTAGASTATDDVAPPPHGPRDPRHIASADTHHHLAAHLASANPLVSSFWFVVKHPAARVGAAFAALMLNFFNYLGDPGSYSSSRSYGTLIGDVYHGWFQPDDPAWVVLRLFVMVVLGALGFVLGHAAHRVLRDRAKLVMFGYDSGKDPNRDPIANSDGEIFVVGCLVMLSWFFGLKIYNAALTLFASQEDADAHACNAGMEGLSYASYNLILAGLLTFVCDWLTLVTVIDQMLQEISSGRGTGFLCYGGDFSGFALRSSRSDDDAAADMAGAAAAAASGRKRRAMAAWWAEWRVAMTRVMLLVGWIVGISCIMSAYNAINAVLSASESAYEAGEEHGGKSVGGGVPWSAEFNTEFTRMLVGCLVAFLNLMIVIQDWTFPDFSNGGDLKVIGFDLAGVDLSFLAKYFHPTWTLYLSAKWVNYLGLMSSVVFDWAYWYMTALVFRPCDYALLWDSASGAMYALTHPTWMQDAHAGAASAIDCPFFTDHINFTGRYDSLPNVVKIDSASFVGAYTFDEQDQSVYMGENGEWLMHAMCIIPLSAWALVLWLTLMNEHVHFGNAHRITDWFERHFPDGLECEHHKFVRKQAERVHDELASSLIGRHVLGYEPRAECKAPPTVDDKSVAKQRHHGPQNELEA